MKCKVFLVERLLTMAIFVFLLLVVGVDGEVFLKQGVFLVSRFLQRAHLNHRPHSTWQVGKL